jgi:Glycosyl hydrolase catalytic core
MARETTQSFFNTSIEYLDRLDYVTHYSWFGSFRSDVSNVGPNGAMLSEGGEFTDIGEWYLGRSARGVKPDSGAVSVKVGRWSLSAVMGLVGIILVF